MSLLKTLQGGLEGILGKSQTLFMFFYSKKDVVISARLINF